MKSNQKSRVIWHTVRMTEDEYQQLKNFATGTICPTLSDYTRRVLLQKPVSVLYRNQSLDDFLADMLQLRKDLQQLSSSFDQAVRLLQAARSTTEIQHWLLLNEQDKNRLLRLVEQIFTKINDTHRLWSHA